MALIEILTTRIDQETTTTKNQEGTENFARALSNTKVNKHLPPSSMFRTGFGMVM
jgi:hypothetical protein